MHQIHLSRQKIAQNLGDRPFFMQVDYQENSAPSTYSSGLKPLYPLFLTSFFYSSGN